ncbi:MAG: phosphatase PAP2 family protein [Frankiaceae bacterium]
MLLWVLLMLAGIIAVLLVAALIQACLPTPVASAEQRGWLYRFRLAQQGLVAALGRPLAALSILMAGAAATAVVCWPLGGMARRLEGSVDQPLLRFVQSHNHHPAWTRFNEVLTLMGNVLQIKVVCVVSAVVLTVLWRRCGWYVPVVVIAAAFVLEKFLQQMLGRVVGHGQHPIPGLGTYPSGGCARLIAIYGTILFLFLLIRPHLARRTRFVCWSVLASAALLEGYSRIYLLKHWFTDVVGGWIFGVALVGVLVAAAATLAPSPRRPDAAKRGAPPGTAGRQKQAEPTTSVLA